jgi:hypothetical protein
MSLAHRQIHPFSVALSKALDESLDVAKAQGISASWVAEYGLKVSAGQLSKYRNPDDPDMLPAHLYPVMEQATGNSILWDALEAMRPGREERHARAVGSLMALFARKEGAAMALLIQAMSPDGPGGCDVTADELAEARPALLDLRVLLDELIAGTVNEKAPVRARA